MTLRILLHRFDAAPSIAPEPFMSPVPSPPTHSHALGAQVHPCCGTGADRQARTAGKKRFGATLNDSTTRSGTDNRFGINALATGQLAGPGRPPNSRMRCRRFQGQLTQRMQSLDRNGAADWGPVTEASLRQRSGSVSPLGSETRLHLRLLCQRLRR